MEKIAFLIGGQSVYWSSLVLLAAGIGASLVFLGCWLSRGGGFSAGIAALALSWCLGIPAARLMHWYCYAETYAGFGSAMTNLATGGFGLLGVFLGCLLAAGITRGLGLHKNFPGMLDDMCLSGCLGIAVGRLASFFSVSDRGQVLASVTSMPWAYPVTNTVSGVTEYRLATFLLQAIVALALAAALALFRRRKRKPGDTALVFLLCYCASQIVLDSTRYDSMYFRFNGFVSIVQVVSALTLAGVIVVFSVRAVRARGFRGFYAAIWGGILALIGCAGYMEYHVQRHGDQALFAYTVMSLSLAAVVALSLWLYRLGQTKAKGGRYLRGHTGHIPAAG